MFVYEQYQIIGLSHCVDLCFVAHTLIIETDKESHPYYENDEIRRKLIENLGFPFISINPDSDAGFDLDVEIAKIYNYINKSLLKLAVNSAEKSLKEKFVNNYWVTTQVFLGH